MAIFHCQLQIIKRSAGRSVVEAAAYRSGEKLRNEWTGYLHDYSRKRGIVHTETTTLYFYTFEGVLCLGKSTRSVLPSSDV